MRHIAHTASRLQGRASRHVLALIATVTVTVVMAQVAQASTPAAFNDCTLANALGKWFNVAINSLVNIGKMGGWALLAIGLLLGIGGGLVSKGHKGWQIFFGAVALIFVITSLIPLLGATAGTCVPKVTI